MFWESGTFWLSIILASSIPIVLIGVFHNRLAAEKLRGLGWKIVRFSVITISIPTLGILALNNAMSSEIATLMGTAMGFAFGKSDA